ncbi:protein-cysteine N-palmitoyltransferase Rasp [Euwallacea fornicatus]|uniref:protein-cysteine N-palmitoyltransferase Rasp n=1 Tax=Euwallacea fornicatus TaxID=995702 RepID=UPI00338D854E
MSPAAKFHRTESKLCLLFWVSAVFYAIYKFTISALKYFLHFNDYYQDFIPGFKSRNRDSADFEWEAVLYFITTIFPFMLSYVVIYQSILKTTKANIWLQISFPLIHITYFMGYKVMILALLQPLFFHVVARLQSKTTIWIFNIVCLAVISVYKKLCSTEGFWGMSPYQAYFSFLFLYWMNLRCVSYCLSEEKQSLIKYLAYCLYFPTLFVGPFIPYEDYERIYENANLSMRLRFQQLVFNVSRCLFWAIFIQISLHFVYVNAASFQMQLIEKLDLCSLCGYGYLMGQFFHLKYVVIYGLSTSLAAFENVAVPTLPRCIGRVHLYSDMWKYFDPGLYQFLKTCIFVPLRKWGLNKLGASLLCFIFVYMWHGTEEHILIWALLNFTGLTFENVINALCSKRLNLRDLSLRRLKNLLAAPLLAGSAVSNFYFFAGKEVGDLYVKKAWSEPFLNQFSLGLILYCCCEVSTEIRQLQARKMGI